jgi:hypothetical protein
VDLVLLDKNFYSKRTLACTFAIVQICSFLLRYDIRRVLDCSVQCRQHFHDEQSDQYLFIYFKIYRNTVLLMNIYKKEKRIEHRSYISVTGRKALHFYNSSAKKIKEKQYNIKMLIMAITLVYW